MTIQKLLEAFRDGDVRARMSGGKVTYSVPAKEYTLKSSDLESLMDLGLLLSEIPRSPDPQNYNIRPRARFWPDVSTKSKSDYNTDELYRLWETKEIRVLRNSKNEVYQFFSETGYVLSEREIKMLSDKGARVGVLPAPPPVRFVALSPTGPHAQGGSGVSTSTSSGSAVVSVATSSVVPDMATRSQQKFTINQIIEMFKDSQLAFTKQGSDSFVWNKETGYVLSNGEFDAVKQRGFITCSLPNEDGTYHLYCESMLTTIDDNDSPINQLGSSVTSGPGSNLGSGEVIIEDDPRIPGMHNDPAFLREMGIK